MNKCELENERVQTRPPKLVQTRPKLEFAHHYLRVLSLYVLAVTFARLSSNWHLAAYHLVTFHALSLGFQILHLSSQLNLLQSLAFIGKLIIFWSSCS